MIDFAEQKRKNIRTVQQTTIHRNTFTAAERTKLDGIATGADVTGDNAPKAHQASHKTSGSDDLLSAPGEIGGTTPAAGNFTNVDMSGILQGDIINNLNAFDFGERVLGLMTDPRFLNVMCEDLSAGNLIDISGKGHDGTPGGTWTSGDRLKRGRLWKLDPNGTDAYVSLGDHDDFSFGDGTNDSPFTVLGVVDVDATGDDGFMLSKYNTSHREWYFRKMATDAIRLAFYDESTGAFEEETTNAVLSVGLHSVVCTYNGVGGSVAANGVTIYIDGVAVASTRSFGGIYAAMENKDAPLLIGSTADFVAYLSDDFGCMGLDAVEWAAVDCQRFHQLCLAFYSEDGATL